MRPWSDFYDYALPDLPGCPFAALNVALRQSTIAFCEQSLAWKYDHPDIAVVVATREYPFVPHEDAVVHEITYAAFDDREINVRTKLDNVGLWNWRNQTGMPQYVLGGLTVLSLVPMPDVAGTLKLTVALKPSLDAAGIDADIFNEYREAIVHGAKARLMLSPRKPYTDAGLAAHHMQEFTIKTGAAGTRAARNYTRAPLQTSIMRRDGR